MNALKTTGLGEPEVTGKLSLFQPPSTPPITLPTRKKVAPKELPTPVKPAESAPFFMKVTTKLTKQSWETIQSLQHQHRLRTGKHLPIWKLLDDALELYVKQRKETTKAS